MNQNRVNDLADLSLVNAQLAQPVTAAYFLKDVNVSGTLTLADKAIANANLTTSAAGASRSGDRRAKSPQHGATQDFRFA